MNLGGGGGVGGGGVVTFHFNTKIYHKCTWDMSIVNFQTLYTRKAPKHNNHIAIAYKLEPPNHSKDLKIFSPPRAPFMPKAQLLLFASQNSKILLFKVILLILLWILCLLVQSQSSMVATLNWILYIFLTQYSKIWVFPRHVNLWCLESYNSKQRVGSKNLRKNGAWRLDNPWRNRIRELDNSWWKILVLELNNS